MATVIKAGNVASGAQVTPDATGILQFNTGSGAGTAAMTIDTSQNVAVAGNLSVDGNTTLGNANTDTILMTAAPSIGGAGLGMGFGFRNRIINGAMVIDQRNAGASVTPAAGAYLTDRFQYDGSQASKFTAQQNAGSVTPPAGFRNYLGFTVASAVSITSSDYFQFVQKVEGFNMADLAWGTASAAPVTLSFWVRSSLTGTFGGSLRNGNADRSYPFTYTISAANTWEQKTITIAGDITGTWATTNGVGIIVAWGLGNGSNFTGTAGAWAAANYQNATGATSVVGTNGATFYITGVQLEKGSTATSFDYRPYGTELALCQRYLPAFNASAINQTLPFSGCGVNTTTQAGVFIFEVPTRTPPTGVTVSAASHFSNNRPSTGNVACTAVNFAASSNYACQIELKAASGLVADVPYIMYANNASAIMLFTGCEL